MKIESLKGGINWRLPAWHADIGSRNQCVLMQNFRYNNEFVESIPGTKKYHGTSLGSSPVTAILPYYNDQTDKYALLAACGDSIYKKDESTNEFSSIASALSPGSIHTSAMRYDVMYIPSEKDGLKKYLGGNKIETVGGGATKPGSFRIAVYMKEVDRIFGISDDAIFGQISWCESGKPEVWDGASVERLKLKKGERVEGAEVLYGKLIIFCTYTVWIYYVNGNEENWRLEEAPTTVGCVAPNTIKKVGKRIWFLGESPEYQLGVYAFDGSDSTLLSDDVSPLFDRANKHKLRNACAELHSDLYTLSFAIDFSTKNNISIDLDTLNYKEDSTPAIYGPHTFGFRSSAVLNNRQKNKEFLIGDEEDGFIYVEGGTTLKGVNGDDGSLLQNYFQSRIHTDDFETVYQYKELNVNFRPRGYFDAKLRYLLSAGPYAYSSNWSPNAQSVGHAGDFSVYEHPLLGTPSLYLHTEFLGAKARGTSIQIEIVNDNTGKRIAFDGYSFTEKALHKARKVQRYAV